MASHERATLCITHFQIEMNSTGLLRRAVCCVLSLPVDYRQGLSESG